MLNSVKRYCRSQFHRMRTRGVLSADWWRSLLPFWMTPGFYWMILSFPVRWFFAAWHERRLRHFLWGVPAVIMAVFLAMIFHRLRQQSMSISYTYWEDAQAAILAKEYPKAEMLLDRILQENTAHVNDARYGLATVFAATGNTDRAELLFGSLAPDNARGHEAAHQRLAMLLSETANVGTPIEQLDRLHWHLQMAGNQETPEMWLAWGRYSVAIQDLESARKYLEKAAVAFPELWITIGEVNVRLGNTQIALSNFERASEYLSGKLTAAGASDRLTRVDYATVLMRLGRLDEARVVLEEGLKQDPEGDWHKLLAALYVNYHDLLSVQGKKSVGEMMEPIARSLEHEPNFGPALNRLMSYVKAKVDGNVELRSVLARVVAEGKQPALAHLALGNLCWVENDKEGAIFHFERAISINPKLAVVMNNLAWLLATDIASQDLERALALVNAALEEQPKNSSFLDTRGMVYQKLGRLKESLTDLEVALTGVVDPIPVHGRLAEVYDQLGRPEMSAQHRQIAAELQKKKEATAAPATPGS